MSKNILITGGTGTLGSTISKYLADEGHSIRVLTRSAPGNSPYKMFQWDPGNGQLTEEALDGVNVIVNLAGESIADKKWTREQKNLILKSRVDAIKLIHDVVSKMEVKPEAFISASAVGYYGYDTGSILVKETSRFGDDFLATVAKEWEDSADAFTNIGVRVFKMRIGIVLSKKGGALAKMLPPVKLGIGAGIGRGDQYLSWIHEEDLAALINFAIKNQCEGTYNSVAPNPVTNREFMKSLARVLKKPFFLPNVPGFIMKLALGQRASMVLGGNRVSSEKLQDEGFVFTYPELDGALRKILKP